jgi:hypothetical protein
MKKFFLVSLISFLVLGFGVAYAQEKAPVLNFTASGFINVVSFWTMNNPPLNGGATIYGAPANYRVPDANAYDKTVAYLDSRAHLKFNAAMGKELSGTIYFEMDSTRWGEIGAGRGGMGDWNGDQTGVELKNVYIDVALPYFGIPAPMTARVGLQALSIRPQLFVYTDGMGISGGIKVDPVMIQPMWFKALEGNDWNADDVDVYGLHVNAKIGTATIGGYGVNYNMNTYPLNNPAGAGAANMWWFGGYADGKFGPVNYNLDFIYDDGEVEATGFRDVDYSGWVAKAKLDYPWEKFNFGVVGHYGTGADRNKTDATGLANGANRKVESFVVPPGSEAGPINGESVMLSMYAGSSGGAGWANRLNTNQMTNGPSGGIWFAKLYASMKATPWYKVTLQGLYIGDTTKHGNTIGNALKSDGVTPEDDSQIGIEFDLVNELQLYKNLKWEIAGGYMFAGDGMDFNVAGANNDSPKNPWAILTRFTYSF